MPRLPSADEIRPIPNPSRRVVNPSSGGDQVLRANQQMGQVIEGIGERMQDQQADLNYAKAKSSFLQNQARVLSELEQDPDYSTFEQRYQEGMGKAKEEASGYLNPLQRQRFELEAEAQVLRGAEQVRGTAFRKESDFETAGVLELVNKNREAALSAQDEPTRVELIRASQEAIGGLASRGYIDQTKAQQLRERTAQDYAEAAVGIMPYDKQIEVLKSDKGVSSFIPADKRASMLDRAEKEQRAEYLKTVGPAEAAALASKYQYLGEAMKANTAKDPDVRSRIDSELRRIYTIREDEKQRYRKQVFDDVEDTLLSNGGDISAIDNSIIAAMDIDDQKRFHRLADDIATGAFARNDYGVINKLTELAATNPSAFAKEDLTKYVNDMDKSYRDKFASSQEKAKAKESDPEITQLYNMNQQIDNSLKVLLPPPKSGAGAEKKAEYQKTYQSYERILRDRIQMFETENQRKSNEKEREQIVDGFLKETVITRKGLLWDTDKKMTIVDVPAKYIPEIEQSLRARGKPVTPEEIIRAYDTAKREGIIDD